MTSINHIMNFMSIPYNLILAATFVISGIFMLSPDTKKNFITASKISKQNTKFTFVDIRQEYTNFIAKSKFINITELQKQGNINKHLKNKEDHIIIVSDNKAKALQALKSLKDLKYNNVFILSNGVDGWKSNGLPLKSKQNKIGE